MPHSTLRQSPCKSWFWEVVLLFPRVSLLKDLLMDQGMPFMSQLIKDMCWLMQVKQVRTSTYHPQTDGLIECFNQTLRRLWRTVEEEG